MCGETANSDALMRMYYTPYDPEWNLTWDEQRMSLTEWLDAWLDRDARRQLRIERRDRHRVVMARKRRRGWA